MPLGHQVIRLFPVAQSARTVIELISPIKDLN